MSLINTAIVFAKAPRVGAVKTRLARDIGAVAAWSFYRATLRGLVRRLDGQPFWRLAVALTPDEFAGSGISGAPPSVEFGQGRGDLGQRMAQAIAGAPPGPVVIVGSDIPAIGPRHIRAAFRALGANDVVFGPATDGGYWLVGARRRPAIADLFAGVRWSGPDTLADTLRNLKDRRVAFVETLADIDSGDDFARWRAGGT